MLNLSQCFLSSQLILLAYNSLTMFIYLTFDENLSIKISSISLLLFFCLIIFFKCDDLDRILTVSDKLFMRVSFFPFVHFCFFQSDWWFMSHMFIKCLSLIDDDLSLMGLKVFLSLVNLSVDFLFFSFCLLILYGISFKLLQIPIQGLCL